MAYLGNSPKGNLLTMNSSQFTGNGSTTTVTITSGHTVDSVIVTENGIVQRPTTDYTISGTTLTFVVAPASGVAVRVKELLV